MSHKSQLTRFSVFSFLCVFLLVVESVFAQISEEKSGDGASVEIPRGREVVEVWNRDDGRGFSRQIGVVESFTRNGLTMKTSDDEITIPAEQVARILYRKSDEHQIGDLHFQQKNYRDAREHYKKARLTADRRWVEVEILERIVRCDLALGFHAQAVQDFATLVELEPEMTDTVFACIPLLWRTIPGDRALEDTAMKLLRVAGNMPEISLLGASCLMFSAQGKDMATRLKVLSSNRDARIATLAEMQSWRLELMNVTPEKATQWREKIESLPPEFRVGPNFVLAQAFLRLENPDAATLAFLRAGYLFNPDVRLAEEAISQGKKTLENAGHADEAAKIK